MRYLALLLAGAYTVHTLRYVLAYGAAAHHELIEQGHEYLRPAPLALTLLLAAAVAELLLRLARGGAVAGRRTSVRTAWAIAAGALLAIYGVQELAEGWLASGHAHGVDAVGAERGWLAVPLAAAVGLAIALLSRVAAATLEAPPARLRVPRARPRTTVLLWGPPLLTVARGERVRLGGRDPPVPAG